MTTIHETHVTEVGPEAPAFISRGLFVTFGNHAPQGLRNYSFVVDLAPAAGDMQPGMTLEIGERRYPITAVGPLARQNLEKLGHVTVFLDGSQRPSSQGAIHVATEKSGFHTLEPGTRLAVVSDLAG